MKTLKIISAALLLGAASAALAQVAGLTVGVSAPAVVSAGTNETLASISLTAGAQGAVLAKLPLSLGYAANSAVPTAAAPFTNCSLRNASNASVALNTGSNAIVSPIGSGALTVNFDQALTVPAGGSATLLLNCDIPASVPSGSAFAVTIFPTNVQAQAIGGGTIAVAGTDPQGTDGAPSSLTTIISSTPGSGLDTGNAGGTTTPGVPNTGAGGSSAATLAILALAALTAAGAGLYAFRRA